MIMDLHLAILRNKGIGLQSIHDKLEILYKGKAHINWQNEPEKFILVVIPIE